MKLSAFANRIRDDLNRFQAAYLRANLNTPDLFPDEQPLQSWFKSFIMWCAEEHRRRRSKSVSVKVKP